ncbi:MAG: STAS domain-containing protein [Planctomycetes bacterium]|nr:STAS domain-containing protein [Planctomycetota bacterium]
MKIDVRMIEEWKVLTPDQSRLDACVSNEFKRLLVEAVEDGTKKLILDLSGIEFIDSSGLGAIVCCFQKLGPHGRVALAGPQESVALMLRLTHVDKVFTLLETPEDILQETC